MTEDEQAALDVVAQYRAGELPASAAYDLLAAERVLLAAAPDLDVVPAYQSIIIDRDGDAWQIGRTRMTCLTPVDGRRILRVARLPIRIGWKFGEYPAAYAPFKLLRDGAHGPWLYETIRGRR